MDDLINPHDLDEWKIRIKELIENDNLRNKKAKKWSEEARKKYDISIIARKVEVCLKG